MSRRWLACALSVVLLAGSVAGCGSSGDVAAEKWASSVCSAVGAWQVTVADLTRKANEGVAAAKSPQEARTSLLALLGGAETASEKARAGVVKAGIPDVGDGKKHADSLAKAIGVARDAYGKARKAVEGLATDQDKTFYDGVAAAMETLKSEYKPESADPTKLSSPDLRKAFDSAETCKAKQ